eukprot:8253666-Pyramimonas_sp.AAC.1
MAEDTSATPRSSESYEMATEEGHYRRADPAALGDQLGREDGRLLGRRRRRRMAVTTRRRR